MLRVSLKVTYEDVQILYKIGGKKLSVPGGCTKMIPLAYAKM